jgi:hypothetical protein
VVTGTIVAIAEAIRWPVAVLMLWGSWGALVAAERCPAPGLALWLVDLSEACAPRLPGDAAAALDDVARPGRAPLRLVDDDGSGAYEAGSNRRRRGGAPNRTRDLRVDPAAPPFVASNRVDPPPKRQLNLDLSKPVFAPAGVIICSSETVLRAFADNGALGVYKLFHGWPPRNRLDLPAPGCVESMGDPVTILTKDIGDPDAFPYVDIRDRNVPSFSKLIADVWGLRNAGDRKWNRTRGRASP